MFLEYDTDGDNTLDFEEFIRLVSIDHIIRIYLATFCPHGYIIRIYLGLAHVLPM